MPKVKVRVAGTPKPEEKKAPREILFRGKRIDNGKWIEGCLLKVTLSGKTAYLIFGDEFSFDGTEVEALRHALVDPETVGQYTGLYTSKELPNGDDEITFIYEGDIVRIKGNPDYPDYAGVDYIALIAFIDGGFCAIDGTIEEHGFRRYNLARMDFDIEVIGNIHDTPELLEEEDD